MKQLQYVLLSMEIQDRWLNESNISMSPVITHRQPSVVIVMVVHVNVESTVIEASVHRSCRCSTRLCLHDVKTGAAVGCLYQLRLADSDLSVVAGTPQCRSEYVGLSSPLPCRLLTDIGLQTLRRPVASSGLDVVRGHAGVEEQSDSSGTHAVIGIRLAQTSSLADWLHHLSQGVDAKRFFLEPDLIGAGDLHFALLKEPLAVWMQLAEVKLHDVGQAVRPQITVINARCVGPLLLFRRTTAPLWFFLDARLFYGKKVFSLVIDGKCDGTFLQLAVNFSAPTSEVECQNEPSSSLQSSRFCDRLLASKI